MKGKGLVEDVEENRIENLLGLTLPQIYLLKVKETTQYPQGSWEYVNFWNTFSISWSCLLLTNIALQASWKGISREMYSKGVTIFVEWVAMYRSKVVEGWGKFKNVLKMLTLLHWRYAAPHDNIWEYIFENTLLELFWGWSSIGNIPLHMTISVKAILFTGHLKANFDNIRFVPCKDLPTNKVFFTNSFFNYRMFKAHREVRQVRWWLAITNY